MEKLGKMVFLEDHPEISGIVTRIDKENVWIDNVLSSYELSRWLVC